MDLKLNTPNDRRRAAIIAFFLWLLLAVIAALLPSCKTQIVTVPEYHTVLQHDTIQTHDSIHTYVREYIKGDIQIRDSIVYRDRWRDRIVEKITHDSIPVPVPVDKIVYKRSGYDTFCSWYFWITLVLALLALAWWLFKKFYLRK